MNESCKWDGRNRPRILPGRHDFDNHGPTENPDCPGCVPCTHLHCRVCNQTHADQTCAECLATARDNLHEIARMCDSLPEEVEHRGIDGEAMMLLGPASNPEARGHLEASVLAGRVPDDYLDRADGELHPLFILGCWDMVYRDALDHEEANSVTLPDVISYLDRNLHYMSGYEHVAFEDLARDLRKCRAHLESVLHDGEQRDTGAPCMTCQVPLNRVWGADEQTDGWECPRCHQRSTEDQYRFAVQHLHREEATHLTDRDCEIRTGVKAGTVRVWANRGHVERRRDSGRTLYSVVDVLKHAKVVRFAS